MAEREITVQIFFEQLTTFFKSKPARGNCQRPVSVVLLTITSILRGFLDGRQHAMTVRFEDITA